MPTRKPDNVQVVRLEMGKKESKWVEDYVLPQQAAKSYAYAAGAVVVSGAIAVTAYGAWWAMGKYFETAKDIKDAWDVTADLAEEDGVQNIQFAGSANPTLKVLGFIAYGRRLFGV